MEQLGSSGAIRGGDGLVAGAAAQTIAVLPGEMLGELAHDARNMVAALELYCDLLEEPGVLAPAFLSYGSELRRLAEASRRLVEKLQALDGQEFSPRGSSRKAWGRTHSDGAERGEPAQPRAAVGTGERLPGSGIDNLAAELEAKRNLLAALAGPTIALTANIQGGALPVRLTREDLTRVLVTLVKNAVEAMPAGGKINVSLDEFHAGGGEPAWLVLTAEDSGPGIPAAEMEHIFEPRFATPGWNGEGGKPGAGWGVGLATCRAIVEAAGGRIHASNRAPGGARIEIELPTGTQ